MAYAYEAVVCDLVIVREPRRVPAAAVGHPVDVESRTSKM